MRFYGAAESGAKGRAGVVRVTGRRLARTPPFQPFPPCCNAFSDSPEKGNKQRDKVRVYVHDRLLMIRQDSLTRWRLLAQFAGRKV